MTNAMWTDVELIFANGERGPAKAAYVGEGWCDVITTFGEGQVRLWCRSDGSDHEFGSVRLSKPWNEYDRPPAEPIDSTECLGGWAK